MFHVELEIEMFHVEPASA